MATTTRFAVYVEEDEQHIEGLFWLMHLAMAIAAADKDYVYAGMKH